MPVVALTAWVVSLVLTFGIRSWLQRRRTGHSGFVGLPPGAGASEWLGGTLFVIALLAGVLAPVLALAGIAPPWTALSTPAAHVAGLALWALGTAATLWAQLAMGDSWRIGVDPRERTALVTAGPFRWVRNPIFTAMMVGAAGLALLVPNLVSAIGLVALVIGLHVQVRVVEEPYLLRTQGTRYLAWASRTGRFLPGCGRLRAPSRTPA